MTNPWATASLGASESSFDYLPPVPLQLFDWHHHDFPLPFLQVQHPLKASLHSLSTLIIPHGGLTSAAPTNTLTVFHPCLSVIPTISQPWFGTTTYFLSLTYLLRAAVKKHYITIYCCHCVQFRSLKPTVSSQ